MGKLYNCSFKPALLSLVLVLSVFLSVNAQSLSGTYTIGGTSPNYTTFTAAVSDLVANGISGPVVFKVAAGNYNESITIPAISGSSATNTVTFSGAGSASSGTRIYFSLTSNGSAVILLNGASYITIDHMTIENTSTATTGFSVYPACVGTNLDNNNTISNCNIKTAISTGTFYNVVGIHLLNCKNATIINSHVSGGLFGIYNEAYGKNKNTTYGSTLIKSSRFVGAYYNHIYGLSDSFGLSNDVYEGNTFDSSTSPYISAMQCSQENGCTIRNNITNGNVASYLPIEIDYPNVGFNTKPFMIYNNMIGNFQYQGMYIDAIDISKMNMYVYHNTIDEENNSPSYMIYADFSGCGGITIEDNILSANTSAIPLFLNVPKATGGILVDGNNYYNTGGASLVTYNNAAYTALPTFQSKVAPLGWSLFDNNLKPHFISKRNLHLDQTFVNPSGVYVGIDVDIDTNARCKLFPTAGADESTFGSGPSVVKFFLPKTIYPNSPTYVTQIAKAGEAKSHSWYVNGVHVSDSIVLLTSAFNLGQNTLKLITTTCFGKDSSSQTFTVSAPTSIPATDFIADKNYIKAGDIVSLHDLSSGGPTKWQWVITPDSILRSGIKVQAIKYVYGSASFQNPQVQFLYGGSYRVCMTASNSLGRGVTVCKKDYVVVVPSFNMSNTSAIVHDAFGYLYDNGGRTGDYSRDNKVESILIDPCADSVYLVFSAFDLYCGYDYLRLYEGRNNKGKNISGKCINQGSFTGTGAGFTGGKAYPGGCFYQCMPNVTKPDTFKAKGQIYIEMNCIAAYQSAGFAAYWWSKPRVSTKAKASFTTSTDTVCAYQSVSFANTTKVDPNDPPTYLWDLDGDLNSFECIGACNTATYPYYVPGPILVTLIATNCGGSDTFTHTINIYNPKKPQVSFLADNTTPPTDEIVFFTAPIPQCIDKYLWTITPSGSNTGKVTYLNSTSATSPAPQVGFSDTGYYDVKLYVENMGGYQKDSITILKYIHARMPYCVPTVGTLVKDVGIFNVTFNKINKTGSQGGQAYTNNANNLQYTTTVAKQLSYNLTVSRTSPATNAINRTVYIDWNGDGSFTGTGEIVASDSNSLSLSYSTKITIPSYARTGATLMRVAVNKAAYSNKPCGKNEFGEYQDYRIYITPYNILPVITLKGSQGAKDTVYVDKNNVFNEPGYSASSFLYGDLTGQVTRTSRKLGSTNPADSFNSSVPGVIYIFSYNVTDSSGNNAITQYRIVKTTKDKTPPNLLVAQTDTILIAVTATPQNVIVPKVISSIDLVDGPRSVKIDSVPVNTTVVGNYIITYTSTDASGNTIKVYRVIRVIDSIKPILTLNGTSPLTLEVKNVYTDAGVQVTDNYYATSILTPLIKTFDSVNINKVGVYTVTYTVTDPSGNKAVLVRTVNVVDTLKPIIKLVNGLIDSVAVFNKYIDPGYTVTDNYDKAPNITVTIGGTLLTAFPAGKTPDKTGIYTIVYTAKDSSGNTTRVTRIVKVQDRTAPVIILNGPVSVSVCRWFNYVDAGYTVTDNYDSVQYIKIDTTGTFFKNRTTIQDYLYITYKAKDRAGNIGLSDSRLIEVLPAGTSGCSTGITPGLNLDKYISIYPNPNTGIFTINITTPSPENLHIAITNVLGQAIAEIHNGIIQSGSFRIDLSDKVPGVYLVKINADNQSVTKRIEIIK